MNQFDHSMKLKGRLDHKNDRNHTNRTSLDPAMAHVTRNSKRKPLETVQNSYNDGLDLMAGRMKPQKPIGAFSPLNLHARAN